jgi:hypothetical protein
MNRSTVVLRRLGASEVSPDKNVVWALKDWSKLGPTSSTQLLDGPGVPEKGGLQRYPCPLNN